MADANHTPQLRGARLRCAVLDATLARIETVGIDDVRVADIAAAAGVHETSVYRRWKTLPRLLLDALLSRMETQIPIPDTGSVRTDLIEFMTMLVRFARSPSGAALIRSTAITDTDAEAAAVRRDFWTVRLAASQDIVRRGIERGEIAATVDPRLTMLTLGGLVHMYITQLDGDIPDDLPETAVDLLMAGLTPR
ncbi:TetR/AcrR family transcriptional regulator [Nocardia cyriacigeorgica]|uniref:TetR/AcrR family transcriptional regulator n=1 Tax=Nocardia cyriacigeorgica TaxID=135487 RepID=UPI001893EC93|nr:TetR/AcrR family transcriptional regulator [Nocardia cyriacigeorgica]MBF6426383.1 TetR/AcrR family transcriptional regulator C-terminal ligand-binding domain-containing protein [Nocardia cyriacigeorgica]BDT89485.1 putative transcriptional regulator, TetR family protein [Nocardia cyriacigeorgica]